MSIKKKESKELVNQEGLATLMSEETLIFLLDCSGSMSHPFGSTTRIGALKRALKSTIIDRINSSSEDHMGFIGFGLTDPSDYTDISVLQEPGPVFRGSEKVVSRLKASGSTPMKAALERGFEQLDDYAEGMGRLVLMSDGQPNEHKEDILEMVAEMHEETGFIVDTIAIGGSVIGKWSGADSNFMREVAKAGGGEFYECESPEKLTLRMSEMEAERRTLIGQGVLMLQAAPEE